MTVAAMRRALHILDRVVSSTPCVACGHPYHEHDNNIQGRHGRCWHPRVRALSLDRPCRCKQYVDPYERAVSGDDTDAASVVTEDEAATRRPATRSEAD